MPGFEWFGDEERREVQDVLGTGALSRYGFDDTPKGHWKARTFERELARILDIKHSHLCSSGMAALNIALAARGVGAGHDVIIPSFTFVTAFEKDIPAAQRTPRKPNRVFLADDVYRKRSLRDRIAYQGKDLRLGTPVYPYHPTSPAKYRAPQCQWAQLKSWASIPSSSSNKFICQPSQPV